MARKKKAQDWRDALIATDKPKRKSRAKYTPLQREARKKFRSAVATLKRKGLVALGIDARKVQPTKALKKTVRENQRVLEGQERVFSIPADMPQRMVDDLKSLGYRVKGRGKNRKIITPETQTFRKGSIFTRATASRPSARVDVFRPTGDIEAQIRNAFAGLKPGDVAAFQTDGYNSYSVYASADAMIRDLMRYQNDGYKFKTLVTFRLTGSQIAAYQADGAERIRARFRRKKRMSASDRANVRKGMRVSRGH